MAGLVCLAFLWVLFPAPSSEVEAQENFELKMLEVGNLLIVEERPLGKRPSQAIKKWLDEHPDKEVKYVHETHSRELYIVTGPRDEKKN